MGREADGTWKHLSALVTQSSQARENTQGVLHDAQAGSHPGNL